MDILRVQHYFNHFKTIFRPTSTLQKNRGWAKTNPEVLKIFKGVALFFVALMLAWISKNETERTTHEQVMNQEWPEAQVFYKIIAQSGWQEITGADFSKILKNHPDFLSTQPMIWETTDHCYLYLTQSPYSAREETQLWACAQRTTPISKLKWQRIGSGFSGINKLALISIPETKKVRSYVDPKEIRY